jgi:hypothetical protein
MLAELPVHLPCTTNTDFTCKPGSTIPPSSEGSRSCYMRDARYFWKGVSGCTHRVRQITITDVPASWQEERSKERSHDSRTYDTGFMLRFGHLTRETLEALSTYGNTPASEIIAASSAQAIPEDFPMSWQMKALERWTRQTQQDGRTEDRERTR